MNRNIKIIFGGEIKKIAKIAGADEVAILNNEEILNMTELINNPNAII